MSSQKESETTTNFEQHRRSKEDCEHDKTTKHQLATRYEISLRTVYRTLELAGISTRKHHYTYKEEFLFGLTRFLLNRGYTRRQVPEALQEFLNQKQVTPYEQERIRKAPE